MKKQTSPTIVAGLALATLLSCGTGLTKAEPHHDLAHQIETDLVQIEVEALLEKFKELTRRTHQLELERVNLEVEAETARGEEERAELEQHLRRAHMTQERLEQLRRETREKLRHIAAELAHHPRAHGEEREQQHTAEGFRERLHHLERQIEELRGAGKHDRSDQLERQANEIRAHLKQQERRGREGLGEREHAQAELRAHFEQLQAKRREAIGELEGLMVAAKQIEGDGEEAQAKRHKLEDRAGEVKAHLGELTEQLEELEHAFQGREREEERRRSARSNPSALLFLLDRPGQIRDLAAEPEAGHLGVELLAQRGAQLEEAVGARLLL